MGVVNSLGYSEILDENRCVDWSKARYNGGVDQIPFISSQTYVYFNVKDYGATVNNLSVGIYFYKIVYKDNKTKTGKIVIVR